MIQISRLLARQLRIVIKRMFGRTKPDLRLIAGPDGLRVQAKGGMHAVQYHDPEAREPEQLVIPYVVLEDTQGTRNEPVSLYCPKKKVLAATWEDRRVERTMQYTLPKDDETAFHVAPTIFTDNPPTLVAALHDAAGTTDQFSTRYALGCMQLRGTSGQIAATDGRQLLLQSGYSFGFPDDVLVHSAEVFGCAELPKDQAVQIGKTDSHVVVRVCRCTNSRALRPAATA